MGSCLALVSPKYAKQRRDRIYNNMTIFKKASGE